MISLSIYVPTLHCFLYLHFDVCGGIIVLISVFALGCMLYMEELYLDKGPIQRFPHS